MDTKQKADGREQRRISNKQRATEIMLELILETGEMPDVETVLERSGISRRSFFRFFKSESERIYEVNKLMANTIASRLTFIQPDANRSLEETLNLFFKFMQPDENRSLVETLNLFVSAKSQIDEYRMPLRKLTEEKKRTSPEINNYLNQYRMSWLNYIEELFAPYLEHRSDKDILVQHIHFNTSWITWATLRNDMKMSVEEGRSFIKRQILPLFGDGESA